MARVVVTGGAGFLGAEIVEALAARGDEVVALDLAPGARLSELQGTHRGIGFQACEITEWARVAEILRRTRPGAIVHCAAVVGVAASVLAPYRTFQVNVEGSLNVMEAMRLFGIPRMIHISSEETYGAFQSGKATEAHPQNPVMPYGISKLAVEHLGRTYKLQHGIECIHLRTCWVYGPRLPRPRIPKILIDAALEGRALHIEEGGDFAVDHTHVRDVVQGVLLALDKDVHPFDAYNIGSGEAPALKEMVAMVKALVPGAELSVGPGYYRHPDGTPVVRKGALDITRARTVLGYAPRFGLRAGIEDYIRAVRESAS